MSPDDNDTSRSGSYALGFAAGFFGGCIGLILVSLLVQGEDTRKGARMGFFAQLAFAMVLRALLR